MSLNLPFPVWLCVGEYQWKQVENKKVKGTQKPFYPETSIISILSIISSQRQHSTIIKYQDHICNLILLNKLKISKIYFHDAI